MIIDIDLVTKNELFEIPKRSNQDVTYLCGNSLGLMPKSIRSITTDFFNKWSEQGVEGHFTVPNQWLDYHKQFSESLARLVGAKSIEVVAMNSLTTNMHLLLASFYQPSETKFQILTDLPSFPSDIYALESIAKQHKLDPEKVIIKIEADKVAKNIQTENILTLIETNKSSLNLVWLNGVNYYSGQFYEIEKISKKCQENNILLGLDLAHAIGNVPLQLHNWNVDFAVWCSYKYLNAGPGAVGGAFIHEKWATDQQKFRLSGWWGTNEKTRFEMSPVFDPIPTAEGWQLSNAPIMSMLGLKASLEIFDSIDLDLLFQKSNSMFLHLTQLLLESNLDQYFKIITPLSLGHHGAQVSIYFYEDQMAKNIFEHLNFKNIIVDYRKPNVIRISAVPLYNNIIDVTIAGTALIDFFKK